MKRNRWLGSIHPPVSNVSEVIYENCSNHFEHFVDPGWSGLVFTGYQRDRWQCDDRSEPVGGVRLHHHRHRPHPPGIHQPEKDLSRLNFGLCQAFIIFHVPHFCWWVSHKQIESNHKPSHGFLLRGSSAGCVYSLP